MRILVIQHSDKEHAGGFRPLFARDGHQLMACIAPDEIANADLNGIDGLWVLGGPMQVWEAGELPWLAREIDLIREAVLGRKLPYFGICLGHQLLAHALGGEVAPAAKPEVGFMHVEKRGNPPMFDGLPEKPGCFQWHTAEVSRVPAGAEILASSARCAVQAMIWGGTAHSVQFHAELDSATLAGWYEIDNCEEMLREHIGGNADGILDDLAAAETALARVRESLYQHWFNSFTR
ncbi:type 1 glutamine amidotransferase [Hoeflea sp. AS16]|uniref:type 1 glutamine amidotransferase n=1 Tax=Hoeflea sp. AS16 TaxID=3135779 RepID=UPI00317A6561